MFSRRVEDNSLQIRPPFGGTRQEIRRIVADTQVRWVEATMHDPSLSPALLDLQWRHLDLPDSQSPHVWAGYGDYRPKTLRGGLHR